MSTSLLATHGWKFNQIGIRVSNMEASLSFYTKILGMKELVRMDFDTVNIALLAYPADGDPGMFAREGLLELIQNKGSEGLITNAQSHSGLGFVKLCFTVPDMDRAMDYVRSQGLKVVKEMGTRVNQEVIAAALGAENPDQGRNIGLWDMVQQIPFVQDPDGYLIELVPYGNGESGA